MGSIELFKELILTDLLSDFFNKEELSEISTKISKAVPEKKHLPSGISKKNREQITLDLQDSATIRTQVDVLITFAENRLANEKFLEFLLHLGQFTITVGEFTLASDVHEKILAETKDVKAFANINANAFLALGELHSRQALWKQSFDYIAKTFRVFKKQNDMKGCARCENLLGTIYGDLGNFKKAGSHFEKALSYLDHSADKIISGKIEINLGIINTVLGNFESALSYYKRALLKFEKLGDLKRIAEIRHNMGMTFLKKSYFREAITEFDHSIAASRQSGFLPTLGITYISKAFLFTLIKDLDLAEAFGDKAMEISYKTNDKLSIAEVYKVKGIIQRKLANYDLAENYLLTSLRMNKELGNKLNEAETCFELGILYKDLKQKKESKMHFKEAIEYYKKINAAREVKNIEEYLYI